MSFLIPILATLILGSLLFWVGMALGRQLLKRGISARDFFRGHALSSLAFLGGYCLLLWLAVHAPQWGIFPLEWRVYGMHITWTLLRSLLLGFCGVAWVVSWHTARQELVPILLLGTVGLFGFGAAEVYFMAPIHAELSNHLPVSGIFRQTSSSSCAPTALATILHRWGLTETEASLARRAGTSRLGTSMPQLVMALRQVGFDGVELNPTWEQMQQINRLGVLSVWLFNGVTRQPHAVALLELDDQIATIADPARGRIDRLNRARFQQIWRNQYLPIFRADEMQLTEAQMRDYLGRWGYPASSSPPEPLTKLVQQFQQAHRLPVTGQLNPETMLLLTGPFLQQVPRLNAPPLGQAFPPEVLQGIDRGRQGSGR